MAPNSIFRFLFRNAFRTRLSGKLWLQLALAGVLLSTMSAPVFAQLSTHAEILEMSRKVADYENQIRFAFVQKDNKTLDQALIELGNLSPNNDIFRLYTQMKEQRQKKSKPSPYHALLPKSVMTTQTAAATEEAKIPDDLQAVAISMVETGASTTTLVVGSMTPTLSVAQAETLSTETISQSQQPALESGEQTPPVAIASPAVQPMPEPTRQPEIDTGSAAGTEEMAKQTPFMRFLRHRLFWVPALLLALLVIVIPLLTKILRRAPEATPPTFGAPGSAAEKNSFSQDVPPSDSDAEVHLRDIVVKLQGDGRGKSQESNPALSASSLEETLSTADSSSDVPVTPETEALEGLSDDITLFHSSESTKTQNIQEPPRASADEETLFRSADQTLTQAPGFDDVIRLGDSHPGTSETVASPALAVPLGETASPDSTTPLTPTPGQDDLRLDWAMDEKVSPSGLTDAQRKAIFDESFDKGCAAFERQDYNSAEQQFSIALSLRPNDPEVNSRLAMVRKALGKS